MDDDSAIRRREIIEPDQRDPRIIRLCGFLITARAERALREYRLAAAEDERPCAKREQSEC
jgi:hypothetical protein